MQTIRRVALVLLLISGLLFLQAHAIVPLGDAVDAAWRDPRWQGAYLIAFLKPGCLGQNDLKAHIATLQSSPTPVLVAALAPTKTQPKPDWRVLDSAVALGLYHQLKARTVPTTVLVDANNRIRAVLEGQINPAMLEDALRLLR